LRLWLILFNLTSRIWSVNPVKILVSFVVALVTLATLAQDISIEEQYYVADIELHTAEEFRQLLERAEQFLILGDSLPEGEAKVTLVLHGPVLKSLLRENYLQNKILVDLAASLSAMEVIDVKACSTWMAGNNVSPENLQPFIEIVTYGPAEVERLVENKHYLYF
jgi:intracellular sulfur oxidation DsrE/DsrF family protein